ncbi:MAG TPA: amidohydrolase, partial [Planctomycetota bacterium]|nr:amidohydrolase [Planctomycetota bacterium]
MRFAAILLLMILPQEGAPKGEPADRIFICARGYSGDPANPKFDALAVKGGKLIYVGAHSSVLAQHKGPKTEVVDLKNGYVYPGFIDAHAHFGGLGRFKRQLDARGAKSFDDLIALAKERAAKAAPREWILGGRWDHASWGMKEFPTHHKLTAAIPDVPVFLSRVDGHAALANKKAMDLAGITRDTPDPPGGDILRDANGDATGIFVDNATDLFKRAIPPRAVPPETAAMDAQEACLKVGLTGVHDMGVSTHEVDAYKALAESGKLKIRLYLALSDHAGLAGDLATRKPEAGDRITVRAVKLYQDGAMGSRGALLLEPYSDKPVNDKGEPNVGLRVGDNAHLKEVGAAAAKNGWQVCVHAIGDRANREVLDAFEAAGAKDARFRIEHSQCISLADIPRFAKLGIIASMQPTHATSDMRWAEERVGKERVRGCYAWRRLLDAGARLAGGSDFPVESENPLLGFIAAVTRQDLEGKPEGGWQPDQRLTREEALRLFTLDAAYAGFEENVKGTLAPG